MAAYQLRFVIDRNASKRPPNVRIWVDPDLEAGLCTETELSLRSHAANSWSSAFMVCVRSENAFMYRIGITAEPGTVWTLEVREKGREVLRDSDTVSMPKEWLIGTVQR